MKKITLFLFVLVLSVAMSAQTKITFEDNTLNGVSAMYNATVNVIANPYATGINTSAYCLDVVNNGYAPIYFSTLPIPAGTASSYVYYKLKVKYCYVSANTGTDLDYPQLDICAPATSGTTLDATNKLATISNVWGVASSNVGVWKQVEFKFSASLLASIPGGFLALKLAKSKNENLIDDVEIVPAPTNTLFDFESNTIGDAITTSGGGSTALVVADPASVSTKAAQITMTAYNQYMSFSVTLPNGKLLSDYDRIYFDLYSTSTIYANLSINANATVAYTETGYNSQNTASSWTTKDYSLTGMSALNTFTLNIGYTSMNSGSYYIDNIKLHAISASTGIKDAKVSPLIIYCADNVLHLGQTVDKVSVYSIGGQLVASGQNTENVNLVNASKGIYVVKASLNGQEYAAKFVK